MGLLMTSYREKQNLNSSQLAKFSELRIVLRRFMRVAVSEGECAADILREWLRACNKSLDRVSAHLT